MVFEKVFYTFFFICTLSVAQNKSVDSLAVLKKDDTLSVKQMNFHYKKLIIPTSLIVYGVVGLESHQLLFWNSQIRQEVMEDIDEKVSIDDFAQYAPLASVYALNAFGVKGKNNFKDRTIIAGTSYLLMAGSVTALKHVSHVQRPDGSSMNSFPSGHTATAFAGAELLWQEYKDVSYWYGISGYLVASGTGLYRMLNNRHWLTDVAAGAGIGILSTKIAYWVFPYTNRIFTKKNKSVASVNLLPFYNGNQLGVGGVLTIK